MAHLSQDLSLEEVLVDHAFNKTYADFPPEVVLYCKLMIIDALGVSIPGACAPGCPEVIKLLRSWNAPASGSASLLVYGGRVTPPQAAFANSMMMHALDFDDTLDDSALHSFVNVLPAALAAAEACGQVSGKMLIEALVLGTDILCRISRAIPRPLSWIRTATCGSFGAAVAAGRIACQDQKQLHNALGVAYSQTSGNAQGLIEGQLVKRMQPGFAAQAGVLSAFLARSGITGSKAFLEGKYGYFNLYERSEYELKPVLDRLGVHYQMSDLSIKPYPCCRMTHSAVDGALELRALIHDRFNEIESIRISVSRMVKDMVGMPFSIGENPQVSAQFSIPYTVSEAMLHGDLFLESFENARITNESTRSLSQKIEVIEDPSLAVNDIYHMTMLARLSDGQVLEISKDVPLGNPMNPLGLDQVKKKFSKCVSYSGFKFHSDDLERLVESIEHLEELNDVSELVQRLLLSNDSGHENASS